MKTNQIELYILTSLIAERHEYDISIETFKGKKEIIKYLESEYKTEVEEGEDESNYECNNIVDGVINQINNGEGEIRFSMDEGSEVPLQKITKVLI